MKLTRKFEQPIKQYSNEQVYKKPPVVDWRLFEIAYDWEIPYGKYKGSTLEELEYEDDWYYSWMIREHIVESWGLYRPKMQIKKKVAYHVYSDGQVWIGIREVEIKSTPSQYL